MGVEDIEKCRGLLRLGPRIVFGVCVLDRVCLVLSVQRREWNVVLEGTGVHAYYGYYDKSSVALCLSPS